MTGLKRAFYVDWPQATNSQPNERLKIQVQRNRGWYLRRALFLSELVGNFWITRVPANLSQTEVGQFLALLLRIVSDWGGLGARTQQGYGVVHVVTEPELRLSTALRAIEKIQNRTDRQGAVGQDLPRLDEFFFAKVRFKLTENSEKFIKKRTTYVASDDELNWHITNGILPLAPIVRYHLRQLIRQHILHGGNPNAPARWRLLGVLNARYHPPDLGKVKLIGKEEWQCENCHKTWRMKRDLNSDTQRVERYKSLIHVSHAYPVANDLYEFRLWGWIPQRLSGNLPRHIVLAKLRQWLGVSNPPAHSFQDAREGMLWDSSCVDLEQPVVLWRESPSVRDLIRLRGVNR